MKEEDGLVHACVFDGAGGARGIGWSEVEGWSQEQGFLWVHLDYQGEAVVDWTKRGSGLDPVVASALVAEETRPRCFAQGRGLVLILRGVNLNPGDEPEDMVSLRIWMDADRTITMRHRRIRAVQDVRDALDAGSGPRNAGDFLVRIADRLTARMSGVVSGVDEQVDALEEEVLTAESHELRGRLSEVRRRAIGMRRYLAPQREALYRLQMERPSWMDDVHAHQLREVGDRTMRYVEDLDEARERAALAQEHLNSMLAEQLNHRMYVLAVVAGIFLPLSLLTGLLGINVGGIPLADSPAGFSVVCGVLVALGLLGVRLFRRWGLL